jgi:peptidoglycan/xylan/chitin deacetylase (PgdA/CDA1 family)
VAIVLLCAGLAGCGGSAHDVSLSAADRAAWPPGPALRDAVPVLVYRDFGARAFERQMRLFAHAGFRTITLDSLARFVAGEAVELPARPIVLTFDGGRHDTQAKADPILQELGFGAVLFVDVGPIEERDPDHLTWAELDRLQAGHRWDVQLQSGTGNRRIRYGPAAGQVGPFYAYRGTEEVLGGWRERVFSDVTYGEDQLVAHVSGYRPLAIAPPFGNYGQAGTNDRRIPRLLIERLLLSFRLVFVQDRSALATPGARNPLGRFEVTRATTEADLRRLLRVARR